MGKVSHNSSKKATRDLVVLADACKTNTAITEAKCHSETDKVPI